MSMPCKTGQWFTSCWNHIEQVRTERQLPASVRFHDVTLRHGERPAGAIFDTSERLAVVPQLQNASDFNRLLAETEK